MWKSLVLVVKAAVGRGILVRVQRAVDAVAVAVLTTERR